VIRAIRGKGVVIVAESGVRDRGTAELLAREGANALLVGTALMRNPQMAKELYDIRLG